MWYLVEAACDTKSSADDDDASDAPRRHVRLLRRGCELSVGRYDCDITFRSDRSISKTHAVIRVAVDVTGPADALRVHIVDRCGKPATKVDGKALPPGGTIELVRESKETAAKAYTVELGRRAATSITLLETPRHVAVYISQSANTDDGAATAAFRALAAEIGLCVTDNVAEMTHFCTTAASASASASAANAAADADAVDVAHIYARVSPGIAMIGLNETLARLEGLARERQPYDAGTNGGGGHPPLPFYNDDKEADISPPWMLGKLGSRQHMLSGARLNLARVGAAQRAALEALLGACGARCVNNDDGSDDVAVGAVVACNGDFAASGSTISVSALCAGIAAGKAGLWRPRHLGAEPDVVVPAVAVANYKRFRQKPLLMLPEIIPVGLIDVLAMDRRRERDKRDDEERGKQGAVGTKSKYGGVRIRF